MAKVMISIPDQLLSEADRLAKRQHRSRSELFREALRTMLDRQDAARPSWSDTMGMVREATAGQWKGRWDSTAVIREDRDKGHGRRPRR